MQKLAALANMENFENEVTDALNDFVSIHGSERVEFIAPREAFEAGYRARAEETSLPQRVKLFFDQFSFRARFEPKNNIGLARIETDIAEEDYGIAPESKITVLTKDGGKVEIRVLSNGHISVEADDWSNSRVAAFPDGGGRLIIRSIKHDA